MPHATLATAAKHLFRFRSGCLLGFVTIVALLCAVIVHKLEYAALEDNAIQRLQSRGGRVAVTYDGPEWLTSANFKQLRRRPQGVMLGHLGDNFDRLVLDELADLPSLEWLDLEGAPLRDVDLQRLGRLSNLQTLYLNDTLVSGCGLDFLSCDKTLETLDMSRCSVSDACLSAIVRFKNLHRLSLRRASLPYDLTSFGDLKSLQCLDLSECRLSRFTDDSASFIAAWIPQLTQLTELYLRGMPLKEADIGLLARIDSLRVLDLNGITVSVDVVGKLQQLESLGLSEEAIRQDGMVEAISSLKRLKVLVVGRQEGFARYVGRTPVIDLDTFVADVQRRIPHLTIEIGRLAYPEMRGEFGQRVLDVPELID